MTPERRPASGTMATAASSFRAMAELVRLRNAAFGAAYTLLGAWLASDLSRLLAAPVLLAAGVILFVVASGNATNDYHDAAADAIAKPTRPIPSGRISPRAARTTAALLGLCSLRLAASLGPEMFGIAAGIVLSSVAYSYRLKEIPLLGNAVVGALCGSTLVYGALAAGAVTTPVFIAAAMTASFVFAQEVFYTVEDEPGDRASGIRTAATAFGAVTTLRLFKVLATVFVVLALSPWVVGLASDAYLLAVVACTIAPTAYVLVLLGGHADEEAIARASRLTRVIWLSSVASLVLLK